MKINKTALLEATVKAYESSVSKRKWIDLNEEQKIAVMKQAEIVVRTYTKEIASEK